MRTFLFIAALLFTLPLWAQQPLECSFSSSNVTIGGRPESPITSEFVLVMKGKAKKITIQSVEINNSEYVLNTGGCVKLGAGNDSLVIQLNEIKYNSDFRSNPTIFHHKVTRGSKVIAEAKNSPVAMKVPGQPMGAVVKIHYKVKRQAYTLELLKFDVNKRVALP